MNYVLTLQLDGDAAVNEQLNKLLSSVGKLSSGKLPKLSFNEWLKAGDVENSGQSLGRKFGESVVKGFKAIRWNSKEMLGGPRMPSMPEWLSKITQNVSETGNMGALGQFIKQRHALGGKTVEKDFWLNAFPPIPQDLQGPDLSGKMFARFRKQNAYKGLVEPSGADLAKVQALPDINSLIQKVDWKKIATGVGLGFSNPYIGARVLSDELGKMQGGKGASGLVGGLFGKGGIAGFAEIFLAFKAFKVAVDLFRKGADIFKSIADRASKFYASALQNGMGLQFSVKRSLIAQVMGVSETDVFRFGSQLSYLNSRLSDASRILAETATPLTQTSWQFKILETDLSAAGAILANDINPAIMGFVAILDELVKMFDEFAESKIFKAMLFFHKMINPGLFLFDAFGKLVQKNNPILPPQAWMKQLPASHWEKMGLVVMGGSNNYAKDIAKNTKDTAAGIRTLIASIKKQPQSPAWGMSPNTAQP